MMQYEQEQQARMLYDELSTIFTSKEDISTVSINGSYSHWSCIASQSDRVCVVDCLGQHGYIITFKDDAIRVAMGRTTSIDELVLAIRNWLHGATLSQLYEVHAFVDRTKRFLEHLRQDALNTYPELKHCTAIRLDQQHGDFFYLWFTANMRACRFVFYGSDAFPQCEFYWDDTCMFSVQIDNVKPVLLLMKRWICDNSMPSALRGEFDWLDIGNIAPYYEIGRGVEGEFILSWDDIERFYKGLARLAQNTAILRMISAIRAHGFDKTLRAGQSMYTLIVSRSRRHGLNQNQPYICFDFHENRMEVRIHIGIERRATFTPIAYTTEIEALLRELEQQAID